MTEEESVIPQDLIESPKKKFNPMAFAVHLGGRVMTSCLLLIIYGIYRTVRSGFDRSFLWYTYVPVGLGILGFICIIWYTSSMPRTKRSFYNMCSAFSGLVPFAAICYMAFFLGLYGLYTVAFQEFHWSVLLRSLLFTVVGFKSAKNMDVLASIPGHMERERIEAEDQQRSVQ